jgi:hypothetical protein
MALRARSRAMTTGSSSSVMFLTVVLVVDPNTKLSFSLTLQRFQPVARWPRSTQSGPISYPVSPRLAIGTYEIQKD